MMDKPQYLLFELLFATRVQHAVYTSELVMRAFVCGEGGGERDLLQTALVAILSRGTSVEHSAAIAGIFAKAGHSITCNLEACC